MHAPGLKVLAPSTPEDAKGLLLAAIADPNPVIFLEHKHLYRRVRGEVPDGAYLTPMRARTARDGDDLVVIAYGAMVARRARGGRADRGGGDPRARPALAGAARRGGDPRRGPGRARRS